MKKSAGDIYINEPVETDKDGNTLTLIDLIDDGENIDDKVDLIIRSRQLYKFLDKVLDERELEIIVKRYGLYGEKAHTQSEVSKELNISRSYVSRLEKKAIAKLKHMYDNTPF
jgi:RNA polymerase sporulation-specific sigma factor